MRNNLRSNNAESAQELRNDLRKNSAKTAEQFRTPGLAAKRYGVILVEPEWRFEPWSREIGMDRAADNHYPTRPKLIASLVKSRSSRLSGNGESGGIFRASAQHCASTASQVLGTPPRNEHGASRRDQDKRGEASRSSRSGLRLVHRRLTLDLKEAKALLDEFGIMRRPSAL